eukprot:scaffold189355_cov27-Tisochrysis_lutea.AAC.1
MAALGAVTLLIITLMCCAYCKHRSARLDVATAYVASTRCCDRLGCCWFSVRRRGKVTGDIDGFSESVDHTVKIDVYEGRGSKGGGFANRHSEIEDTVEAIPLGRDSPSRCDPSAAGRLQLRRRLAWDTSPANSPPRRNARCRRGAKWDQSPVPSPARRPGAGPSRLSPAFIRSVAAERAVPMAAGRGSSPCLDEAVAAASLSKASTYNGNGQSIGFSAHVGHLRTIERLQAEKRELERALIETAIVESGTVPGAGHRIEATLDAKQISALPIGVRTLVRVLRRAEDLGAEVRRREIERRALRAELDESEQTARQAKVDLAGEKAERAARDAATRSAMADMEASFISEMAAAKAQAASDLAAANEEAATMLQAQTDEAATAAAAAAAATAALSAKLADANQRLDDEQSRHAQLEQQRLCEADATVQALAAAILALELDGVKALEAAGTRYQALMEAKAAREALLRASAAQAEAIARANQAAVCSSLHTAEEEFAARIEALSRDAAAAALAAAEREGNLQEELGARTVMLRSTKEALLASESRRQAEAQEATEAARVYAERRDAEAAAATAEAAERLAQRDREATEAAAQAFQVLEAERAEAAVAAERARADLADLKRQLLEAHEESAAASEEAARAAEAHAAEVRRATAAAAAFEARAVELASDLEKAVGARAFAERDREAALAAAAREAQARAKAQAAAVSAVTGGSINVRERQKIYSEVVSKRRSGARSSGAGAS